jgi:hypothetical protein
MLALVKSEGWGVINDSADSPCNKRTRGAIYIAESDSVESRRSTVGFGRSPGNGANRFPGKSFGPMISLCSVLAVITLVMLEVTDAVIT